MMAFKDVFDLSYLERLGRQLEEIQVLESRPFIDALGDELLSLEMKARSLLIAREIAARSTFPYDELMAKLVGILGPERPFEEGVSGLRADTWRGFAIWPFTMIIAENGLEDWDTSFWAMNQFTRRFTAEFCIRPFLRDDSARVLDYLNDWVSDPSEHVRRLVSEGTRPFLPWGLGVPTLSEHRDSILALLDQLKCDDSQYVRRSVANHLNDLSRTDADRVTTLCSEWLIQSESHLPLIRHALRTLVKKGDPKALRILGFGDALVDCISFTVSPRTLHFPGELEVRAELESDGDVLVDFTIEFATKSGKPSKKTFKWFKKQLDSPVLLKRQKSLQLKAISTREFYSGTHRVLLHVNGKTLGETEFQLVVD